METLPDQTVILERLLRIRECKQQVLDTIDKIKDDGDEIDRDVLAKLIKSYDNFKDQEEQYLIILQKILSVKQQYCSSLGVSTSHSDLSELSDRTPLPSFSANLVAEISNTSNERQQQPLFNSSCLSKSFDIINKQVKQHSLQQSTNNNGSFTERFVTSQSSNGLGSDMPTASLAAKGRELEELKDKLETLKTLCDIRSEESINQLESNASGSKSLESKLAALNDSKRRVDKLLSLIEIVDEETDVSGKDTNLPKSVCSPNNFVSRSLNLPCNRSSALNSNCVVSPVIDMPASSALRTSASRSTAAYSYLRKNQNEQENGQLTKENDNFVDMSMQDKYNELSATKNRLAKLQQLMGHLQDDVDLDNAASSSSSKPPVVAANNRSGPIRSSNDDLRNETEDAVDSDVANMAVLSFRMRSAYESKLNEQQMAVQNLQAEHERLMSIKNQLMSLSGGGQQNRSASGHQTRVKSSEMPNQINDGDDPWRSSFQQQDATPHRSESKTPTAQHLNNLVENGSPNHCNLIRQKSRKTDNLDACDRAGATCQQQSSASAYSAIANNPRLPSFRRNNQLDDNAASHSDLSGRRYTVGASRRDDIPMPSTPRRTSFESSSMQHQASGDCRRSDSRERCASMSLEEQYVQLQQHIDSIRSIFQQLMKDHNGGNSVGAPVNQYGQNLHIPPAPFTNQLVQHMAQQQQTTMDHLLVSLMNPSSLAVQQQQLMVSLFSCQQQLQLQQMEMRHLQQLCQDLFNSRRTVENVVDSFQQQNRSRSASIVQQQPLLAPQPPINLPPLDGRPLSTSSLYNLLAPNPYLPFSYYGAPQVQQYANDQHQQHQQHQQRYSHLSTNSRTSSTRHLPGSKSSSYNAGRYPQNIGAYNGQMSQSLIEQGSGDDTDTGFVNSKIMSASDTAARSKTVNSDVDACASYNKSNAAKKQNTFDAELTAASRQSSYSNANPPDALLTGDQFDVLREMIYSEVATLISQNEQRPHFLLELFRELQLLSSDHLRTRALQAVRNVLNSYLINETDPTEAEQELKSEVDFRNVMEEVKSVATPGDEKSVKVVSNLNDFHAVKKAENDSSQTIVLKPSAKDEDVKDSNVKVVARVGDDIPSNATSNEINKIVSDKSNVDVVGLEEQIQNVVDELIPFLKDNVDSVCNQQLLQYLRKFVISLALTKCLPNGSATTFFQRQLSSILDDTLAKFQGQRLQDCGEELLGDVSEVLFNELAFFRLMQNIDSVDNEPRKSDADESEDNLGPETTEPEDGSESDRSSVQASSPEPVAGTTAMPNDISEISEDIDVSAVTAVSTSREAVRVDVIKTILEKKDAEPNENVLTDKDKNQQQSADVATKPVEVVLTTPLTVQVTSATDEDENSMSSNTSESLSMHTAGNQVLSDENKIGEQNGLTKQTSADSRETSPPDELLMDAEDIPESIDTPDQTATVNQEREITTFDLDFEPHPEDKLQLTVDSVEFRNLYNHVVIPDEVEEEEDDGQEAVGNKAEENFDAGETYDEDEEEIIHKIEENFNADKNLDKNLVEL